MSSRFQSVWKLTHKIAGTITVAWIILSLFGLSFSLSKWNIPHDSELFAILVLLVTTLAGGSLMRIARLPPLLGMLGVGLVWRNYNFTPIDMATQISTSWAVILRFGFQITLYNK